MDEQLNPVPETQTEQVTPAAENPPEPVQPPKKSKTAVVAVVAVLVVAGLYLVNRFWIAPVAIRQAHASGLAAAGPHPAAPDFSLPNVVDGGTINLADYKGKVLMIDFWATWCGPCRVEIPSFVELQDRYRGEGFAIIGLSQDDGPEPVRQFYKEFKMNYPVAIATDDVDQLYGGVVGLPTTFVIGRDGRIYAKHTGTTDPAVFEEEVKTLLAAKPEAELTDFTPAAMTTADEVETKTPEQIKAENNSEVPGVDLSGVDAKTVSNLKENLNKQHCSCGCNMTVIECRFKDRGCAISRKLAKEELDKLTKKAA